MTLILDLYPHILYSDCISMHTEFTPFKIRIVTIMSASSPGLTLKTKTIQTEDDQFKICSSKLILIESPKGSLQNS